MESLLRPTNDILTSSSYMRIFKIATLMTLPKNIDCCDALIIFYEFFAVCAAIITRSS